MAGSLDLLVMASTIVPALKKANVGIAVAETCCEQGGYGSVWQDPRTECYDVGFCFVSDSGWRLEDILRFLQHRSPHDFNTRVKMSTCCQIDGMVDVIFDPMHICLFDF